ncbi:DHH family phosphoesterase, partial [Candidatus Woesearchaeota archaeon]|nr:DHH family phosphoesterase [Candidatus Woesearchaeota archaeon]
VFVFTYSDDELSLTKDVANELLYRFPDKIIILGRERSGEVRCSLRSAKHNVQKMLENALVGVQGYGGGHEHACGASIKKEDFEQFVNNIRKEAVF